MLVFKRCRAAVVLAGAVTLAAPLTPRADPIPGGSLDPTSVPKFVTPLVKPPAMPRSTSDASVDYQIAVRQFTQQILPPGFPVTTVWSYGSVDAPSSFNYPAFTIEAQVGTPIRVKWINDLADPNTGNFLRHLLPVDQTLHWANPPGECVDGRMESDCRGKSPGHYQGPVPIVTHVHGSHTGPESDGFPEAWYLPAANNIPGSFATRGHQFGQIAGAPDVPGQAIFRYRNDQPATTLWYHDHTLGMTRVNVYAGPAGFYLLRGGADDAKDPTTLPGPAPGVGADPFGTYYEIPIAIQDRSFDADGSLFYPATRNFFDGFRGPVSPGSDVPRVWNPEFFGNMIVVNGRTWPYLDVEPRRYRFRLLNGSNSRFLILTTDQQQLTFWTIGGDGGFLRPGRGGATAVPRTDVLLGPAERADVIVDFSAFAPGTAITLLNAGPDEPFGGGTPGVDFAPADPGTTGQVMQFRIVPLASRDTSTDPAKLKLPSADPVPGTPTTRRVSLNEASSTKVCVNSRGQSVSCNAAGAVEYGPVKALLGTVDAAGNPSARLWEDPLTENPALDATETWEIYNFTADAHPIHIHLVQFDVLNREGLVTDAEGMSEPPARLLENPRPPEAWETGPKDTVIVYPGEVARVTARFDIAGQFVWHCHIVEHEDNEMMRPYRVGP